MARKEGRRNRNGSTKAFAGGNQTRSDESLLIRTKGPITIAGVTALGVAGAIAISHSRNARKKGRFFSGQSLAGLGDNARESLEKIEFPTVDEAIDWIEETAATVGRGSQQAIELSGQARSISGMLR